MKILHLIKNVGWHGGVETYVLSLVELLHEKGAHQAIVFEHKSVDLQGVGLWINLGDIAGACARIEAWSPDVVHVHNVFDQTLLSWLIDRYNILFTTHGYQLICPAQDFYLEKTREICGRTCGPLCLTTSLVKRCMPLRPPHSWRAYGLSQWAIHNRDRIHLICPCEYAASRHLDAGFAQSMVTVLPYFCSVEPLVSPRPRPPENVITFMGRLRTYKGYDEFVKILSGLPRSVSGLIVGDLNPRTRASIDRVASEAGVADRIRLQNWAGRSEISHVFSETSVFVFPSIWPETLGIVGLEAMAHGVPVVAYDVGGVKDWLEDGGSGFRVKVKDSMAAASAIEAILGSDGKMVDLGGRGIEIVRRKFSPKRHVDLLMRKYETM